jgi:hypothetical protein
LDGKTLVEVLEQYVLKDPQVDCLRQHAIAEGGKPDSFGWGLGENIWPLSYGSDLWLADGVGPLLINPDADRASVRAADRAMGKRFARLMRLLAIGAIDAIGVPSKGGRLHQFPGQCGLENLASSTWPMAISVNSSTTGVFDQDLSRFFPD